MVWWCGDLEMPCLFSRMLNQMKGTKVFPKTCKEMDISHVISTARLLTNSAKVGIRNFSLVVVSVSEGSTKRRGEGKVPCKSESMTRGRRTAVELSSTCAVTVIASDSRA